MNTVLMAAFELHQAGRYADAARRYHFLLSEEPENADALHLFGVMHHQCGHSDRAVELIGRATALRPGAATFHVNLAEAYRGLGQHEQAITCCRTALQLAPGVPEAFNTIGLALEALGRAPEALEQYRAALDLRPDFALARNNLGTTLKKLGHTEEAVEAFRAAVESDPTLAIARANLGQALVETDRAAEGLVHCQEAVRLEPSLAAAHNNLGNAFRALDQWPSAHAAYAKALRLSPDLGDARIHANLGLALQRENQLADAFACFRRAVELAPDDAEIWQYLANAHVANEDHAAAIPCFERVVALKPEKASSHADLGWALQEEGRLTEAAACYGHALQREPDNVHALMKQAGLHEELGALDLAEAGYRRASAINKSASAPLACLATLLRGRLPDADCEAIRSRLDDGALEDGQRASLLFGMAHTSDARGEVAHAVDCLDQANALALEQRIKQNRLYDPAEHARFVDRLIETFTSQLFERLAGAGDDTRQPIFVFGMPRSGTTLVEQVLASHSHVHAPGELRLVRQTFDSLPAVVDVNHGALPGLDGLAAAGVYELCRRHHAALRDICERVHAGFRPERVVDKMPDNYLYLGLIALLFPRATLIHVRRDPRDVALSCWMTNFRSIRWANVQDQIARRIHEHTRIMSHWQTVLPRPMHEVIYERFVADFDHEARRLVTACGLDWEPACLNFHQTTRPVRTASVTQVRQPLYRKAVARWKNYEDFLADFFARLT